MLERYRNKRDFARTPEPPAEPVSRSSGALVFVVQKHAAQRLHYDFRLELDGVLKSWSVPKGPALNPKEKRLAVLVEDHPLDYGSFEGIIPKGQYGAGQVIVWDNGSYSPDEDNRLAFQDREEAQERMRRGLERGKLSFLLRGRKLKGSWTLVRTARSEKDWLLIKHQDGQADTEREVLSDGRSVLSGITIEEIREGRRPVARNVVPLLPQDMPAARAAGFPDPLAPMLSTLVDAPFSDPDWLFEPKLDGIRAIASISGGKVKLHSRRGLDVTDQYPALGTELARQPGEMALDGEIIALDEEGKPSFQRLQERMNLRREADIRLADGRVPVLYYAFDLLYLDGYDLRGAPLRERREMLARVIMPSSRVRLLEHFDSDGEAAYAAVLDHGLEGIIAKRWNSPYESGKRSGAWLKIKATLSDEFVIGGYTRGQGSRAGSFGALLLGYCGQEGQLIFAGHVGSGFDDDTLAGLRQTMDSLATEQSPFHGSVPVKGAVTWLRPELVAEVKFAQWTKDNLLRAPVFLRLRTDKAPGEVRRSEAISRAAVAGDAPTAGDVAETDDVASVIQQLEQPAINLRLQVQGYNLAISNLDRVLWPASDGSSAVSKRDLLAYLAKVSPYIIGHLRDRPLTLARYPEGIDGETFFQKHWSADLPPFVETVLLYSEHNKEDQTYLVCNNLPTLLWLGQLANIELHTWYSRTSPEPDGRHLPATFSGSGPNIDSSLLNYPDFMVFDLDPYIYSGQEAAGAEPELNRQAFAKTAEAAYWLKETLDSLSLPSFLKTSGRTGLHIYVPILRQFDYDTVRSLCQTISAHVLRQHPRDLTMEWTVSKRTGKVFLDHNQNSRGKTLASIYSPRPLPGAPISMPLGWDELREVYPSDFTIRSVPALLAQRRDLWAGILAAKRDLQGLLSDPSLN